MKISLKVRKAVIIGMILAIMAMNMASISYATSITETEGNNDPDHANVIPGSYLNQQISGSLPDNSDCDFFKFTPSETSAYVFDFSSSRNNIRDLKASLCDSQGNLIWFSYGCYYPFEEVFKSQAAGYLIKDNVYYIEVFKGSADSFGNYNFTINEMPSESDITNGYESNSTTSTADVIPSDCLNKRYFGEIKASTDVDYFSFTPSNDGGYAVELSSVENNCTAYLYDGQQLLDWENEYHGEDANYHIDLIGQLQANKTYHIKVVYSGINPGNYYFKINPRKLNYDESEPNNSFETANFISDMGFDKLTTASIKPISGQPDYDFYSFSPSAGGIYTFQTCGTTDTVGYLYNSSQAEIANNDNNGTDINFKISYTLSGMQTYYLKVKHNVSLSSGDYSIKITPPESLGADANDNGFDTATLYANSTIPSSINSSADADYYKFTAPATGTYTVETIGFSNTSGEAFDSSRAFICNDDTSGQGSNFRIELNCQAGSTYYVKVTSPDGGTGCYTLSIYKGKVIKVPKYTQQPYDLLCWATSASMMVSGLLMDNTDRTLEAADSATKIYPSEFNKFGYLYNPGSTRSPIGDFVASKVSNIDYEVLNHSSITPITFDTIKNSIDNTYPVLTRISWDVQGGGHFQVITGYKEVDGVQYVIYNDPWDGKEYIRTYSDYCDNNLFDFKNAIVFGPKEIEPDNNSIDTANLISLENNEIYVYAFLDTGDADYYSFIPNRDMNCTIKTTGNVDTYGVLYNSSKQRIGGNDNSTDLNFLITATLTANTTYYIKVSQVGASNGFYKLVINLE